MTQQAELGNAAVGYFHAFPGAPPAAPTTTAAWIMDGGGWAEGHREELTPTPAPVCFVFHARLEARLCKTV